MSKNVDVIGIGAINFDFIFSSRTSDLKNIKHSLDDGDESFVPKQTFQNNLFKMQQYSNLLQTQVGGSALLALKTIKSMCSHLQVAYAATYGYIPECAQGNDFPTTQEELEKYLADFIDDTSWLFKENTDTTGCALVKLHKKQRQFINVYSGANDSLLHNIQQKGEEEFIRFLSSAKWIHMTSLHDVYQFKSLTDYVRMAKERNPLLKVSLDPGSDYTKHQWNIIKTVLPIADYVFLSKSEFANISINAGLSSDSKAIDLGKELIACKAQPQIIIVKDKSCNVLLSLINNQPFCRTYYHPKLSFTKILNDTGAGDAFAGGFITGMLSPELLSHQPAPIQLGAIAASERLKSVKWPTTLKVKANAFIEKNMKDEKLNRGQKFKIKLEFFKKPIVNFILGVVTGVIAGVIANFVTS